MAKKRIFTVGFELPGSDFEYVSFNSDQTLLDADIILIQPTLGGYEFEFGEQYGGKSILSHHYSFAVKKSLDHWRNEIVSTVNAGKLVVVYLVKPIEFYRYTGEKHYSGTGRSRVATQIVVPISSYEAIPNIKRATPKSGSSMRLEKDAAYLTSYWSEYSACSPYAVEIEGDFNKVLLKSSTGDRVVGAAFHGKHGVLLFLPPLEIDDEFYRDAEEGEDEDETYWTKEALIFGKKLIANLVHLADALKQQVSVTPAPGWTLNSEYRLAAESEIEGKISAISAKIIDLQTERDELDSELEKSQSLRRLLYEQGRPLEKAILEAMGALGFDVQNYTDGDSEFDGIFVCPEGRCLGEAEGKDNKAVNIEKFSQLERNIQEDFERDEITEHAKGLLFGNAYRLMPLAERGPFFTDKCLSAAKRIGAALVRTPDLFVPARYLKEHSTDTAYAKECREAIFRSVGVVVNFPKPST